ITSVSIHNKWGKITNVNLADLGVTKVVVEDFSQKLPDGETYTYDGNDTGNKGDQEGWAIFDKTDSSSSTFAANTVTGLDGFASKNVELEQGSRAFKVTLTKGA
ncbi:MAG: hypothetical protein RSB65_07065, partial [Oscillospiraceae bacterium]